MARLLKLSSEMRIIPRPARCSALLTRCLSVAARANEHDFVIVGAGSAGCILTNRLSSAGNDVCLIEAGASDNNDTVQMPMGWSDLFYNKSFNWDYWTEPQKHSANRRFYWPRGKTLGGTSSINCMVYMRPHPLDLERWVSKENAVGWSFAETLPYFKRLETYHPSGDYPKEQLSVYRGSTGPIHVTSGKLRSKDHPDREFYEAIVEAGKQFGLPYTHDPSGYQQEGIFWTDSNSYKGMRMSTSVTYLKSACESNAKHVQVHTNLLCTKLLFDDSKKRVIGVEAADVNDRNKVTRVYARRDVIVSAGAINSPQLLLLSGIGDANHLEQLGIKPVVNLPGVGQNLQDHIRFEIVFESRPLVVSKMSDPDYLEKVLTEWNSCKTGLASLTGIDVGAHFHTSDLFEHPNVQTAFSARIFTNEGGKLRLCGKSGLTIVPCTQREFSRGFVKLSSANPFDYPIIDPQLFTDPRDLIELVDAFKMCRNIAQQKALVPHLKSETTPGTNVKTDKEIEQYLQNTSVTSYHPCGSCKMGDIRKDPMAVVDSKSMKVFGVDGLRVADASVMPSLPSSNLNAPTMMIAEKTSDIILGRNLPPENAPFYRRKNNLT